MKKIPKHIRLAYLVEIALKRLSKAKNFNNALYRHSKLVQELKLDNAQEDFRGFWINGKLIDFKKVG